MWKGLYQKLTEYQIPSTYHMEAGSKKKVLKGQNSLQCGEIFLFLSYIILSPSGFSTKDFHLISILKKGTLNPELFGFMFLFLHLYSSDFTLPIRSSPKYPDSLQQTDLRFSANSSKTEILLSAQTLTFFKKILPQQLAADVHFYRYETPGFIPVEAPSSQLEFPVIIASNSYMLNQISCL